MGAARAGQLSSPCGVAGPSCCLRAPGHASLATPASSLLPPCCSWHPASNPFLTSFQPYTPLGPRCPEGSAVAQVRMWPSGLGGRGGVPRSPALCKGPHFCELLPASPPFVLPLPLPVPPAQALSPTLSPASLLRPLRSTQLSCRCSLVSLSGTLAWLGFPPASWGFLMSPLHRQWGEMETQRSVRSGFLRPKSQAWSWGPWPLVCTPVHLLCTYQSQGRQVGVQSAWLPPPGSSELTAPNSTLLLGRQ